MNTKLLKQKILDLAIRGKLVPQDPNDEPASVLLERIRAEKERLVAEGKIKRSKSTTDNRHYLNVPFEIPDSWNWVRLDDYATTITDFVASGSFASLRENVKYYNEENYAVLIRTIDFRNGFQKDLIYTDKHGYDFLNNSNLVGGELILSNIGASIGKVFLAPKLNKPMTLGPNSILVKTSNEETTKYIYYAFSSSWGWELLHSISSATAQGKFNKTDLREVFIPVPPFLEQQRIIAEIELLFAFVDELEINLSDLRELVAKAKSKILDLAIHGKLVPQNPSDEPASELLKRISPNAKACDTSHYKNIPFEIPDNWVWVKLGDISDYGKCHNVDVEQIGQDDWVLELEDIEKDTARIIQYKTKSDRTIKGTRHKFTKDCVLYSKLRTYLNKVLVPEKDGFCTTEIIPINFVADINPQYMCSVLRSQYFVDYTNQKGYGVKMPRLSTTDAKNGLIPLPPIDEQNRIVNRVEETIASLFEIDAML